MNKIMPMKLAKSYPEYAQKPTASWKKVIKTCPAKRIVFLPKSPPVNIDRIADTALARPTM